MRLKVLILLILISFSLSSSILYCKSNASVPFDGLTLSTPLNSLAEAFQLIILNPSEYDSIFLLPSSLPYYVSSNVDLNQNLKVSGQKNTDTIIYLNSSIFVEDGYLFTLEMVKIKLILTLPTNFIIFLSPDASLLMDQVSFIEFGQENIISNFIQGRNCTISFLNSTFSNLIFAFVDYFVSSSNNSSILLDSCLISNSTMRTVGFFSLFTSKITLKNSILENVFFDSDHAFLFSLYDSNMSLMNNTLFNFTFSQGSVLLNIASTQRIFISFFQCYISRLLTSTQYILFHLNGIAATISFEEVFFHQNTVTTDHAFFFLIENGDFIDLNFSSVVLHSNFGIFLEMYFVNSSSFTNFYVWDHNIRPNSFETPFHPNIFFYIESTIYLSFTKFILNGAYSNIDVAGPKIHLNNNVYSRNNGTIQQIFSSGIKISINFTDCVFSNTFSIDTYWLDKGSALSFHSDLPVYAHLIRVFIIDNSNDLGSTCIESWGQGNLKWIIIDSYFINNTATAGSSCLSMYIVYISITNSTFENNTLTGNPHEIQNFREGSQGGVIYGETDLIIIKGCRFRTNSAFQGGVFYFYVTSISLMTLTVTDSDFKGNRAKIGGVFSVTNVFSKINFTVNNSFFTQNQAFNGGCFYLAFQSPSSLILMSKNSFSFNKGLKGGVCYLSVEGSQASFIESSYISNIAWNFGYLNVLSFGGVNYLSEEANNYAINLNNIYQNNTSYSSGGVYSINRGFVKEINGNFSNNVAASQGGTLFIRNSATCMIFSSVFNTESATIWGGSIVITENASIFINESTFENCEAKQGGVFFIENHNDVTISGCTFSKNQAYDGGVFLIYSTKNDLALRNCSFFDHSSQKYLIMTSSSLGILKILNITSINNNCTFIYLLNSIIEIENLIAKGLNCTESSDGCIVLALESKVSVKKVYSENVTTNQGGTLFYSMDCENFTMDSIYIHGISGGSLGGCAQILSSNAVIWGSSFYSVGPTCIYFENSFGKLENDLFDNIQKKFIENYFTDLSHFGGFVSILDSYNVTIESCLFLNNGQTKISYGGAINAINSQRDSFLLVNNSVFSNNTALKMGGALFFQGQDFIVSYSNFINNSAEIGGALYFFKHEATPLGVKTVNGNNFTLNLANSQGGAIYFHDDLFELINNNNYTENMALYGPKVASFPVFLRVKVYNNTENIFGQIILNESLLIFDSFNNSINDFLIEEVPSGQKFKLTLLFELLDFYNQTIISQDSGSGHLQGIGASYLEKILDLNSEAKDNLTNNMYDFNNTKISLSGDTDRFNKNGSFYFTDLTFFATPTSYFILFISNEVLTEFYPRNSPNFVKINNTVGLFLPMHLKSCLPGELYLKEINYCSVCPSGKYSLNIKDAFCLDCPPHATCFGGNLISIEQGYWRVPDPNALTIAYCFDNPDSCLGGLDNSCQEGYDGVLCSVCSIGEDGSGYMKIGKFCVKCMNVLLNSFMIIGFFTCYGILLFLVIKANMKINPSNFITNELDRGKVVDQSLLLKIVVDHMQFLGISQNLGFTIPDYLSVLSTIVSGSVYFLEQLFSFDCFISNNQIFNLEYPLIFIRSMCVSILPIFSTLMIVVSWMTYWIWTHYRKNKKHDRRTFSHIVASIVITLFFLQPNILNSMSKLFGCVQLGNENYVLADMNIKCWAGEHRFMMFVLALPCLIIWNVGVPLIALIKIFRHRRFLKHEDTVLKYGFMYNGFDRKSFYWGFVKYFQKALIILLRVSQIDEGVKLLTILLIWFAILLFQVIKSVYVHQVLNDLEFVSNLVNFLTLFLSLYALIGVQDAGKAILFSIIIVMNCYFFVIWIYSFLTTQKKVIAATIKRISSSLNNSFSSWGSFQNIVVPASKKSHFKKIKPIK